MNMTKIYKWKTDEKGVTYSGRTASNKKQFKKMLRKGVKLVEFIGEKEDE